MKTMMLIIVLFYSLISTAQDPLSVYAQPLNIDVNKIVNGGSSLSTSERISRDNELYQNRIQNQINEIQNSTRQNKPINCTSYEVGGTVYTNCN